MAQVTLPSPTFSKSVSVSGLLINHNVIVTKYEATYVLRMHVDRIRDYDFR